MIVFRSATYSDTDEPSTIYVVDSNLAEDATYAEWNSGTAYVAGDIVKLAAEHKLYESINSNTNKNPVTFLGVNWIEAGATNRWKAFDQYLQSQTVGDVNDITYELQLNTLITSAALFNLAGTSVTVRAYSPDQYAWLIDGVWIGDVSVDPSEYGPSYDVTRELIDYTVLVDWFEYFFSDTPALTEVLFQGIPGYTGYTLQIEIMGSASPARVGEIAIGKGLSLGSTTTGAKIGQLDFSTVTTDTFGNVSVIRRDAAKTVEFPVSWPSSDTRRIEGILSSVRGYPAVYLSDENDEAYGLFVYGFYETYDISIVSRYVTFATIDVRSLT